MRSSRKKGKTRSGWPGKRRSAMRRRCSSKAGSASTSPPTSSPTRTTTATATRPRTACATDPSRQGVLRRRRPAGDHDHETPEEELLEPPGEVQVQRRRARLDLRMQARQTAVQTLPLPVQTDRRARPAQLQGPLDRCGRQPRFHRREIRLDRHRVAALRSSREFRPASGRMCRSARLPGRSAGGPALRRAGRRRASNAPERTLLLADAINGASANDEVIVTAGEYTISGAPINVVYGGLQIHGDLAGPMPRVVAELDGLPAINLNADGSSLSYLEVVNDETEAIGIRCVEAPGRNGSARSGSGKGPPALVQFAGLPVRDSLLRGRGNQLAGMESLGVNQGEPASTVAQRDRDRDRRELGRNPVPLQRFRRRIAHPDPDQLDRPGRLRPAHRRQRRDGANRRLELELRPVKEETAGAIAGAGNQTAPPLFVDGAAGDYREAPGSPTIDAGSPTGIGPLDLAGNPRALGPAPDIGAFEFVPPPRSPERSPP